MTKNQWLRRFITRLREQEFTSNVEWHLRAIRAAQHRGDVSARQSAAAVYRAFLAEDRSAMRALLADTLMRELGIVATQHVAKHVMRSCFGVAMDTGMLDHYFSVPGRDASVKHMKPAKRALASRPDLMLQYAALYQWYCKAQHRYRIRIASGHRAKGYAQQVHRRLQLAPHLQPAQLPAASEAPQQKRFTRQLPLLLV